jgi:glutamyl-tRNA synthetase
MNGWPLAVLKRMSWTPDEETLAAIRHLAIQNAIEYEGKAVPGSVIGRVMATMTELRQHGNVVSPLIIQAVTEANSIAASQGLDALVEILQNEAPHLLMKREKKERRTGLPELANAVKGKVVLRFAPNPNGPLSFGHARGLVINSTYAKEWDGELILRFDDTDTTVKPPLPIAYQQIPQEAEWLIGFKPHRIVIASERMPQYYEYAIKMLNEGFGYVCQCSGEDFKKFRESKTQCPCRENSVQMNIELWEKMNDGTFVPGDAVVRVKTDMELKNPALRDWPALRIQDSVKNPHPREGIGSKYKVWPLLDFQSAVEDYLQGVTHIIRGKDLMDSTRKQTLLYQHFGWKYPETMYWGRVKVHEWGGFSTSQMRRDIEAGLFEGWNDPRLPTLSALKERGITAQALRNFWVELGVTQKDISVPLSTLYSHNTKEIDASAPRVSFVKNPVQISLSGDCPESVSIAVHPNDKSMGQRKFELNDKYVYLSSEDSQQGEVRLKDFCDINLDGNSAQITSIERKDRRSIIHWVGTNCVDAELIVVEDGKIISFAGKMEMHNHPIGTMLQLERIGYGIIVAENKIVFTHN